MNVCTILAPNSKMTKLWPFEEKKSTKSVASTLDGINGLEKNAYNIKYFAVTITTCQFTRRESEVIAIGIHFPNNHLKVKPCDQNYTILWKIAVARFCHEIVFGFKFDPIETYSDQLLIGWTWFLSILISVLPPVYLLENSERSPQYNVLLK